MKHLVRFLRVLGLFLVSQSATTHAAIVVHHHYRLGEIDPGGAVGTIATNTLDSFSGSPFMLFASPSYSADVPANINSFLSLRFTGNNHGITGVIPNVTDNFGVEAWVKTTATTGSHFVLYNGHTALNGYGFLQAGTNYIGLFGGVVVFGSGPAPTNQWTHVAIVCSNGIATLYVNGIDKGSMAALPNPAAGSFTIATKPDAPGIENWNGWIDEVRVFSFPSGAFRLGDLLWYDPATLHATRQDNNLLLTWSGNTPRSLGLEYSTNLTSSNWIRLPATLTNGFFTVTDPLAIHPRFYRLSDSARPPCGTNAPPYLPENAQLLANGTAILSNNITVLPTLNAAHTFDASAFVDPAGCDGDALAWSWTVTHNGTNVQSGLSGTASSILSISTNSLFPGVYTVGLDVIGSSGLVTHTNLDVRFVILQCPDTNVPIQVALNTYVFNGVNSTTPDPETTNYLTSFPLGGINEFGTNGVDPKVIHIFNHRYQNVLEASVIGQGTNCPSDYTFQWLIEVGFSAPYANRGMTGYLTPKLTISKNALPDDPPGGIAQFTLVVKRLSDNRQETFFLESTVGGSQTVLTYASDCLHQTNACPTCICTLEVLLPTTEPH